MCVYLPSPYPFPENCPLPGAEPLWSCLGSEGGHPPRTGQAGDWAGQSNSLSWETGILGYISGGLPGRKCGLRDWSWHSGATKSESCANELGKDCFAKRGIKSRYQALESRGHGASAQERRGRELPGWVLGIFPFIPRTSFPRDMASCSWSLWDIPIFPVKSVFILFKFKLLE